VELIVSINLALFSDISEPEDDNLSEVFQDIELIGIPIVVIIIIVIFWSRPKYNLP